MEQITKKDLALVNDLSSRTYSGNRLLSNASEQEKAQLKIIKLKLKDIAKFFANKYNNDYGPFDTSVATGNDIAIGGSNFKRIWSGIFKGAENKQYASQISFVMNPTECCLDVGFYFGRASGHSRNKEERIELEGQLKTLGISLSNTIINNEPFRQKYFELFDFGFTAYSSGQNSTNIEWFNDIRKNAKSSQIIAKIYPNDFDVIENSKIDSFVSQIIFLMGGISSQNTEVIPIIKPLTPEQRAKQAERLAEIGNKGELYVMEREREKLKSLSIANPEYPKHVALESTAYGFDVLSLDQNEQEIFIEVKTTTRALKDPGSKRFFISTNEFNVYEKNKSKYKLHRVYDIENSPSLEELDLEKINKIADGYICKY
jgi:hypothetical protein